MQYFYLKLHLVYSLKFCLKLFIYICVCVYALGIHRNERGWQIYWNWSHRLFWHVRNRTRNCTCVLCNNTKCDEPLRLSLSSSIFSFNTSVYYFLSILCLEINWNFLFFKRLIYFILFSTCYLTIILDYSPNIVSIKLFIVLF